MILVLNIISIYLNPSPVSYDGEHNNNNIYFYSANSTIQFSNALYNSRGNQINIAQIIIFIIIIYKSNQTKSNVGFWWEGKTGVPEGKPLIAE